MTKVAYMATFAYLFACAHLNLHKLIYIKCTIWFCDYNTPQSYFMKFLQNCLVFQKFAVHLHSLNKRGTIAQLVEQRTENPCVPGSIPGGTTKEKSWLSNDCQDFFIEWNFYVLCVYHL